MISYSKLTLAAAKLGLKLVTAATAYITGTPGGTNVLTANLPAVLGPATSWQWVRNGVNIAGETAQTYTQNPALDAASSITVLINGGAFSASVSVPAVLPVFSAAPTIASASTTSVVYLPATLSNNGSPAATLVHDLYDNGVLAVTGYVSGTAYTGIAGDTATLIPRAVQGGATVVVGPTSTGVVIQSTPTYNAARMNGANIAPVNDFSKTLYYTNLLYQSRGFVLASDPYSYTNYVALKANGYPADGQSFAVVVMSQMLAENFADYLVEFTGTCDSVAALLGCTVKSGPTYNAGTGKTSVTLNAPSATAVGVGLTVTNPSGIDNFKFMAPGYLPSTTKVYRDEVIAHYKTWTSGRFMDWLLTNGSTVTDWAGSNHAGGANLTNPVNYRSSLKACFDFAAACDMDVWVNIPHKATDDFIIQFVTRCLAWLPPGKKLKIEYSNETWNFQFQQWADNVIAACTAANIRHNRSGDILSMIRASNVVTVTLNSPHGKTTGDLISAANNNLGSVIGVPITVTGANAFTYAQTGADSTPAVGNDFTSYVALDLTHEYAIAATGPYTQYTGTSALKAARRYEQTRMRTIYNAIVAAGGDTSRIEVVKGVLLGYVFDEKDAISYALGKYGDINHCTSLSPAPYLKPATPTSFTDATSVFTQLETVRASQKAQMIQQLNFWGTLGMRHIKTYEGGPHNDVKGNATVNAAIAAAHSDDRMRVLILNLIADWRDRGGEQFTYYMGGATSTYDGTANNTWQCALAPIETAPSQPKFQANAQLATTDMTAQPLDTITWGNIVLSTVWNTSMLSNSAGNVLLSSIGGVPDIGLWVTPPAAGTYTMQCDFHGHLNTTMTVQVLVNDVTQGAAVTLPSGNYATDTTNPTVSITKTVTLTKGKNWVSFRVPPAPRAAHIYARTLRFS